MTNLQLQGNVLMGTTLLDRGEHGSRIPTFEHEAQRAADFRGA
jgi:hypothetical protein